MEGLGLGALGLVLGDIAGFDHGVEDQVAALDGALRMAEGREVVRALDHAGEQRAFGQVELLDVFAEVSLRGFAKPVDGKAAALSEVDLVGVELEDLLLGKAVFELESDDDLDDLALDALFRGKEESARQLHGERRSALGFLSGGHVADGGFGEAEIVDAAVLEEPA